MCARALQTLHGVWLQHFHEEGNELSAHLRRSVARSSSEWHVHPATTDASWKACSSKEEFLSCAAVSLGRSGCSTPNLTTCDIKSITPSSSGACTCARSSGGLREGSAHG